MTELLKPDELASFLNPLCNDNEKIITQAKIENRELSDEEKSKVRHNINSSMDLLSNQLDILLGHLVAKGNEQFYPNTTYH